MSAYMNLGSIKGNVTEKDHKGWVSVVGFTHPISRSMKRGAVGHQRSEGQTALGDISVSRVLDKSSPKIAEACAKGTLLPEVEIHYCSEQGGKHTPLYTIKLKNCIVTEYTLVGTADNSQPQVETMGLNFSAIDWEYTDIDPETFQAIGKVPASYVADNS